MMSFNYKKVEEKKARLESLERIIGKHDTQPGECIILTENQENLIGCNGLEDDLALYSLYHYNTDIIKVKRSTNLDTVAFIIGDTVEDCVKQINSSVIEFPQLQPINNRRLLLDAFKAGKYIAPIYIKGSGCCEVEKIINIKQDQLDLVRIKVSNVIIPPDNHTPVANYGIFKIKPEVLDNLTVDNLYDVFDLYAYKLYKAVSGNRILGKDIVVPDLQECLNTVTKPAKKNEELQKQLEDLQAENEKLKQEVLNKQGTIVTLLREKRASIDKQITQELSSSQDDRCRRLERRCVDLNEQLHRRGAPIRPCPPSREELSTLPIRRRPGAEVSTPNDTEPPRRPHGRPRVIDDSQVNVEPEVPTPQTPPTTEIDSRPTIEVPTPKKNINPPAELVELGMQVADKIIKDNPQLTEVLTKEFESACKEVPLRPRVQTREDLKAVINTELDKLESPQVITSPDDVNTGKPDSNKFLTEPKEDKVSLLDMVKENMS